MSRETDSSSSGPNGRGGAAYPSGTPPYGTPAASDAADAGRSATQPEERKTETTLTTRIRINIPGSRPIPPVVVRTPMADADASADSTDGTGAVAETTGSMRLPASAPQAPAADAAEPPAPAEEKKEKTSDWFAPRKATPKGGAGGGTNGAGLPGGSRPADTGGPAQSTGRPAGQAGPMGGPRPGTAGGRPGGTNGAGLPGATGAGPVAPGHGGGTGSFDVSGALGGTGSQPSAAAGGDGTGRDSLPYFDANGQNGQGGPAGPTGGPVTGDGPMMPPGAGSRTPGPSQGGQGLPPGGPGATPTGPGVPGIPGVPGGGLSDDTAILTPQRQVPEPDGHGYGANDNVSGHTVTSGIPVVPGGQSSPFPPGGPTDGPVPHTPKAPEPAPAPAAAKSAKPAKKKGRSKLVLLAVGLVAIGGVAYGAGLLMNRSDVPKGTTVLGVDIGGGTRDDAVKKLDNAFGERTNKALQLSVDGDTVSLKPDQSGLQLDSKATVSAAATSDYNPVSVIGSLFGQKRVVEPVMPVDEEKLQAALERAAGGSGSASDGTIKFESGKAVAVYGKTGKGIDAASSTQAVENAYRTQVETGSSTPVKVPTVTKEPTVAKAEVDRMMKKFAQPAMSANVTVKTDDLHAVSFSPQNSLWKFLGVKAQDGKLVEYYDKTALKQLYGNTFDGVLVTRGTGKKTAVTVEDVISALRPALLSTSAADRIAVIDTNPS
ncbi:hypothetical protein [Streptomyces sp. NPDC059786]|uniref:hypothetical protein n=1 Tax=Streptomyces sp. NPDC059786 TaxID=3346946 RepID=UPI0036468308